MVNFTLILWITGCSGINCPIPVAEFIPYETLELCEQALIKKQEDQPVWMAAHYPYVGACLEGEYPKEDSDDDVGKLGN